MNYKRFLTCVREHVEAKIKKGDVVQINHVIKNNGTELDGINIVEKGVNITPTIYLNDFYLQYLKGKSIEDIVDEIFVIHNNTKKSKIVFDVEKFADFKSIKGSIFYKVINYGKNVKLLEDVPHKKVLDLAVVFYLLIKQEDDVNATALIHNNHLKTWGVTENEVYKEAVINTPRMFASEIKPLSCMLGEMAGNKEEELSKEDYESMILSSKYSELYVLTNSCRINGAACIFYDTVLEKFANLIDEDLFILPSSIHEVIILPKSNEYDKKKLVQMVREVNAEGVAAEEILSDNVYEYNRKDGLISM